MKLSSIWKFVMLGSLLASSLSCTLLEKTLSNTTPTEPVKPVNTLSPAQPKSTPINEVPTENISTEAPTDAEPQPNAFYDGISFYYDPSLAKAVQSKVIPATEPVSDNMPAFEVNPKIEEFDFIGYTINGTFHEAHIMVFSVEEYKKLDNENVSKEISSLKKLLAAKPSQSSGYIPLLPIWNAAQVINPKVKYIAFQNGEGVRFLTQYGQDISPINNDGLFYTFQGITNDGKYYVSAILPVNHPILPKDFEQGIQGRDYEVFAKDYKNYIADIEKQLGDQKDDSFNPQLGLLDAMIKSIKIDK